MALLLGHSRKPNSKIKWPVKLELSDIGALHVIGSPGEGKSTFLGRLTDACMDAGEGVLLLDPKGDLAQDVVRRTRHTDKLIYLAPGAYDGRSFSLNLLEIHQRDHQTKLQEITGENVMQAFYHMGSYDPELMALIGVYLRAAIKLAYTKPQPTLIDVLDILLNEEVRRGYVATTRRADLRDFWEFYESRGKYDKLHQIDSTLRRLWPYRLDTDTHFFVANPTSTLPLADWLDDGKLVVINLAQRLGEMDAERIGNLIVAYLATQYQFRDSELFPWNRERRWRVIVDEFWRFAANPYGEIIRYGRTYNIYPVVAHQDMGQLSIKGKDWSVPSALGLAAELSFRRSRAGSELPPGPAEVQAKFLDRQRSMRKHEADWTFRGSADTSTQEVMMPGWEVEARPEEVLDEALAAAYQYTSSHREILERAGRLEAKRRGGRMEDDATTTDTPKRKRKAPANAANPRFRPGTEAPQEHEPDPPLVGSAAEAGPTRLVDLGHAGEAPAVGRDDQADPEPPAPPKKSQGLQKRHQPTSTSAHEEPAPPRRHKAL